MGSGPPSAGGTSGVACFLLVQRTGLPKAHTLHPLTCPPPPPAPPPTTANRQTAPPPAGAFFANWASVLLIVMTAQGVGLLIGATVMNPQSGQTLATIFMLATMLVGERQPAPASACQWRGAAVQCSAVRCSTVPQCSSSQCIACLGRCLPIFGLGRYIIICVLGRWLPVFGLMYNQYNALVQR